VEMATRIHERTGELVVLTDGVHGVALVNGRQQLRATLPGVIGRFAVGSGDAFLGGLVGELDRGAELPEALRTAVAAGVANAGTPGPANFSRAEVDRLRSQVRMQAADA
jgi:fructose-1-phosphate kinase PfkB-like protein